MHARYKERVQFLSVYVREAHPTDGWRLPGNEAAGIKIRQPRSKTEREAVAKECCSALKMSIPLVVDEIDDRVGHAYSAMPDRLYIIDGAGRVVYKGGRGPRGFKPAEMEQALIMLLLDEMASGGDDSLGGTESAIGRQERPARGEVRPCGRRLRQGHRAAR